MEHTIFYAIGLVLVAIVLLISIVGLRRDSFPASRLTLIGGAAVLVVMVVATTTSAVVAAREEMRERNEEAAHVEQEMDTEAEEAGESPQQLEDPQGDGGAAAETAELELSAPADNSLTYNTDSLEAEAGEVTIRFDNQAALEHDVALEREGDQVAKSDLVSEATTEVSAELEPGEYVFFCTVPGHREGGMEGTLTVK